VRSDARDVVLKFTNSPAIMNALLEFAPMMPITRDNAALVEQAAGVTLPPLRDPTWRVAVRRALLERLMQAIAGKSELARVDQIADLLAELYVDAPPRAEGEQTDPDATPVATTPPALEVAVVQHRLRWQREAELMVPSNREPFNLSQLERRRRALMELAKGRVQEFEAEQVAVCELMAFVCVAEQPARADAAAQVLSELVDERRKAKHIFDQLLSGERARMKLWMLRFAEKRA
jgi:hypothetical protein